MPHRLSLAEMAALIRRRRLSPIELVEAHLAQISKHNPRINAFFTLLGEEARSAAKQAEAALTRGDAIGSLHGIPVTIKESFDIAGMPTRCASRLLPDAPAGSDATAVRRLRMAGAILLGKTNCPEFLASYETDNYFVGRSKNPWDPERTPGGSSGGESAAIAARFSAGGIGSDGGGSIRIPAHFCGIAGLKPTTGRISGTGHRPPMSHPIGLLMVAGPMARTANDVRLLFEVLAGYDSQDPFSVPVPMRHPEIEGVRVGLMEQFSNVPVQPAIRDAVHKAGIALASLGFAVEPFQPAGLQKAPNLWGFLFSDLRAVLLKEIVAGREQDAHWTGTEALNEALARPEPTPRQILETLATRDRMRSHLLREMEQFPVLLLPPASIPAFRHRERRWQTPEKSIGLFQATMAATPFNLLGLPALVIPFALDEIGLPIGVQLVGRPFEDEMLLEIGTRLEEARGPFPAPPGFV